MKRSTITAAIALGLATGSGLGLASAQSPYSALPPPIIPQPNTPTTSHEWTGSNLRFSTVSTPGCTLQMVRAFNRTGTMFANLRNTSSGTRVVTVEATLQGTGQSKTGGGSASIRAGQTGDVQLMTPYGGSLLGSTLTVRVTGCRPAVSS
jgi:hypothetical protein